MFGLGPTEMIVIAVLAVLLFGSRLPKIARSVGGSIVEFKRGLQHGTEELDDVKKTVNGATREMNNLASSAAREFNDVTTLPKVGKG